MIEVFVLTDTIFVLTDTILFLFRYTTKCKVEPSVDELVSQTDIAEADSKDINDETDENTRGKRLLLL